MKVTLINPNIVTQKGDYFGSGIPYMPVTLAYLAASLREKNYQLHIIDAFGEKPEQVQQTEKFYVQGLSVSEIIEKVPKDAQAIFLYAGRAVAHFIIMDILDGLRKHFTIPIIILENTQAVTAYSLLKTYQHFFDHGADYVLIGEAEERADELLQEISKQGKEHHSSLIDGLIYKNKEGKLINNPKVRFIKDLDILPFPAWELFPIENYWKLGYTHGPLTTGKFLPLLTSRGCPYGCKFCVTPLTSGRRWRARSAKNVVDEIAYLQEKFGVFEFHFEDLNPTVNKERAREISQEIIDRKIPVILKIVAGTKIDVIEKDVLDVMQKAGFAYISLSPESGSPEVLKLMDKPFEHEKALDLVAHMHKLGITTQACFVLGFPGETFEQLMQSRTYVKKLTKAGIDEIALFIMTPVPGSEAYDFEEKSRPSGFKTISDLTFSPTWRSDYKSLNTFRWKTYALFFFWKLRWHPIKVIKQAFEIPTKKFKTKMMMTAYRVLRLKKMMRKAKQGILFSV